MNANQENPVFVCSLKAISTLWSTEKQKKLITLSDMIKFDGDKPYKIVDTLATYSMINPELLLEKTNSELFEKKVPGNLIEVVGDVHVFAIECGLKKTRKKAASLLARLLSNEEQLKEHGLIPYDGKELHYAIERIRDSFKDEVEDRTFLSLTLDEKEWYEETLPSEILADQDLAILCFDLEEATKCLAVERYVGCVFHCMRVMEATFSLMKKWEGPKFPDIARRNWGAILDDIEKYFVIKHKSKHGTQPNAWKKEEPFYSDVMATLSAVKDAWRNKIIHFNELAIDTFYDPKTANDIRRAVLSHCEKLTAHPK